jgi:TRAP-type C4-dicarboxylate transport system permease small subunit
MLNIISEKVNKAVEFLLFVMLASMTAVVFIQVIFRYFLNAPIFWTEELVRYLMIWIVYLGASIGLNRGSHIGFTYVTEKVGPQKANWFYMISSLGILAFCVYFTYYGFLITLNNTNQFTAALQLPMSIVYSVLPVSGTLCILQLLNNINKLYLQITEDLKVLTSGKGGRNK